MGDVDEVDPTREQRLARARRASERPRRGAAEVDTAELLDAVRDEFGA